MASILPSVVGILNYMLIAEFVVGYFRKLKGLVSSLKNAVPTP